MPRSRIPSPARSQGVISTPRRDKLRRRTRSVCSPAQCNLPVRLSSLVSEAYKLSPMPKRQSVLTDETDIEIVPGRQSWWKKLGDDESRDVMDVLGTKDMAEIKNLANEFDVEVLSQEKKNYTLDLPESSDGESITSIIIPQQKLFAQKDHNHQNDFAQILNSRDSQSKHKSHVNHDKDIKVAPKNLFSIPSKPRNRPVFPAALLNMSSNKTMNKTKEMTVAEVKGQVRSLFGNRPGTKRKNMFADFIVSDSEDDIPDIQPKVFGFQKNVKKNRRESSSSRASRHSPTSSIDLELDDWKLLPSSTLVGNQLEDTTPVKRARLSKLSEVKESVTMSTINKTMNKTKQSNKSMNAKNKSKISPNSKLDLESSKLQDDNINVQSNDQGTNSSTSRLTRNKSKSIRETSLTEANRSKTINKSKNITNKNQSMVNKADDNQGNVNLSQDGGNLQNELLDEGEDNEDFTLEYENDDEQNMECVENHPDDCIQSKATNNTLKQTNNKNILDKENQNVEEGTYNRPESTNKSQQINNNMDIDTLDGNATKEPVELNNKQEIQNINNEKLNEFENVKNKTNVSLHNTSKKHNKSKQNKVENDVDQENHNNTRNEIENKNAQNESNYVSHEIGHEGEIHHQSKHISKVIEEENENNAEENVNCEQNSTEVNEEENDNNVQNNTKENSEQNNIEENEEVVSDTEDQNESREAHNESQDESNQIDSEQEQNETEEQEEMEDDNQELNESDKDEEDNFDTAQQDDECITSNHEEQSESTVNKTEQQQNESVESNENEEQDEENEEQDDENEDEDEKIEDQDDENEDEDEKIEDQNEENEDQVMENDVENEEQETQNEEQDEENEEQDDENEDEDEKIEDQDEENEDQVMENDVENEEHEMENEEEEDDEEQDMENDQESNASEVESNEDESAQDDHDGPIDEENDNEDESAQDDHDGPIDEENDNEDEEVSGNKNDESPNITHDTTGKHLNIQKVTSPEAILHDKTNQIDSFMAEGRNTSVRKTKSIMIKTLNIRPSLAPVRESTGFSDGTRNSSADNSGWDSHRTTRKTLRQTFGKDFTPSRKSLRALVMEKSAKRHTNFVEKEADLAENVDNKIPQANSTELPHFDSYEDPEPVHVDETAVSTVEESNHEEHEMSKRTRQTTLEMYLEKIKQDNLERRRRIEEQVRNSLKTTTQTYNPFLVPRKPVRRVKAADSKPRTKQTRPLVSMDMLPAEVLEDLKYKPPKRFKPKNASWVTKRLYKFLETKLEPKYDYKARVRAEKVVETIYNFTKDVKKHHVAPLQMVDALKFEMARLNIVTTHFDFYEFIQNYMPREIRIKVNPDVVNNIPLPKQGVFADIIT